MPELQAHQDIQEGRPLALDHVIGQPRAVGQLKVALNAYVNDRADGHVRQAFPHTLLVGPSGVGKSTLAQIIANELGTVLHDELAQNISSPQVLHGLLMLVEDQQCIFLDEVHELLPVAQTTLYRALEDRKLFLPSQNGVRGQSIDLPPFTLIAATTDEWCLSKPLRDRFKLVLRLTHYEADELAEVVTQRARRLGWPLTTAAARGIASRGRGTPRVALRLLEAARRTVRAGGTDNITSGVLKQTLDIEGLDDRGLDPAEQRYLRILAETGGPVRMNVIATSLGLPRQTVDMFEQDLLRLGLIAKDQGSQRLLTEDGHRHVRSY